MLDPVKDDLGVGPFENRIQKEAVVITIVQCSGAFCTFAVIGGCGPFQIEHGPKILLPLCPQRLNGGSMGLQRVVHGAGRVANIAVAGCVVAQKMTKPCDAPEFIDCRDGMHPVADTIHDDRSEIGEPIGDVRMRPSPKIGQGRGHFPMIQRDTGFDPAL